VAIVHNDKDSREITPVQPCKAETTPSSGS